MENFPHIDLFPRTAKVFRAVGRALTAPHLLASHGDHFVHPLDTPIEPVTADDFDRIYERRVGRMVIDGEMDASQALRLFNPDIYEAPGSYYFKRDLAEQAAASSTDTQIADLSSYRSSMLEQSDLPPLDPSA